MTSGFVNVAAQDLDAVLAPRYSGWPEAAATGFVDVSGNDLSARYAPISTGSAVGATLFAAVPGDLATIFAGLGTTGVQVATQPSAVSGAAAAGNPSGTVTSNTTTVAGAKGGGSYTYTCHIASGSATPTNPSSATSAVTNSAVPAGTTITGTLYWAISDGVTSVNTSTAPWSLQNTTPGSWTFSITAGQEVIPPLANTGYQSGNFGSGSSLTLPDGNVVLGLYDFTNTDGVDGAYLQIRGFGSDPGKNYIASIVSNGKTHTPSDASLSYSFGSGTAIWEWSAYGSTSELFGFTNGDGYDATINF